MFPEKAWSPIMNFAKEEGDENLLKSSGAASLRQIPGNPYEMPESEDSNQESPPRSGSPSPSTSQCLDPEESAEATKDQVQGSLQEHPDDDLEAEELAISSSPKFAAAMRETRPAKPFSKKTTGRKTKPLSEKQRAAIQAKLDLLEKNLRPVVFFPAKGIDFVRHERLFKTLGLWNFVHHDFSSSIRVDLLTQLIASYDQPARRSWVDGCRIAVSRPDLARALGLQWKREKATSSENKDPDHQFLSEEESIDTILDFMSNWMLLHEEDACILPGEVMAATQLVKEGQAHKVDWSALIWTMVEKELLEAPVSGSCYYASHLQCLMKHQKPGIFELQEPDEAEAPLSEEEHDTTGTGLCLSLGGNDHGEEQDEHFMRRCNLDEEEEDNYANDISNKFSTMERLTSTDLLHAIDTENVPFSIPNQHMEPTMELLDSSHDQMESLELDPCIPSSSLLKAMNKREMEDIDDGDERDVITHFSHGNHSKRMRIDGSWDLAPLTLDKCIDEAQSWIEKAKMFVAQKEEESTSAQMQVQYMNSLLQQKEHHIQLLEKDRLEEQQRRQMEYCRLEHETMVMSRIIHGYRKALADTRQAFAEYRNQYPHGDEQLYKDDGSEGDVLSIRELERRRILKEEERCSKMIDEMSSIWMDKLHGHDVRVQQLETRLLKVANLFEQIKKSQTDLSSPAMI